MHIYEISTKTLGVHQEAFNKVQDILNEEPATDARLNEAINILEELNKNHPGCAEVLRYETMADFLKD